MPSEPKRRLRQKDRDREKKKQKKVVLKELEEGLGRQSDRILLPLRPRLLLPLLPRLSFGPQEQVAGGKD